VRARKETDEQRLECVGSEKRAQIRTLFYFVADSDVVEQRRRAAIAQRDAMLAFQKNAGASRDADMARFFKAEAQEAMKEYRGACLVLGHLAPGGDCPWRRADDWPLELIPYAKRAAA
jgi:hypothetical protein